MRGCHSHCPSRRNSARFLVLSSPGIVLPVPSEACLVCSEGLFAINRERAGTAVTSEGTSSSAGRASVSPGLSIRRPPGVPRIDNCQGVPSPCFSSLSPRVSPSQNLGAPATKNRSVLGSVDWRRPSNLDAAFAASATASGLESVPLFDTFRYEVDLTCGGVLGSAAADDGSTGTGRRHDLVGNGEAGEVRRSSDDAVREQRYSPATLDHVSPRLVVKWPLGLLFPMDVLRNYAIVHRALFRHHVVLHRLRRLRLVLRELEPARDPPRRAGGRGAKQRHCEASSRGVDPGDKAKLHWLHLFRHEMQHVAGSLQVGREIDRSAHGIRVWHVKDGPRRAFAS